MRPFCAALSLTLALLTASPGCSSTPDPPPPPVLTEVVRAQFGGIGVRVVPQSPTDSVDEPTTGALAGLGVGTLRGVGGALACMGIGASEGARTGDFFGMVIGAAAGLAVGVVYIPFSIVAGTFTAADPDAVEHAGATFTTVLAGQELLDSFRMQFERAAADRAGVMLVPPDQADTVVELHIAAVVGGSTSGAFSLDEPFALTVSTTARVVRSAGSRELFTRAEACGAAMRKRTFADWGAGDGGNLRSELDESFSRLADRYVDEIFLRDLGPGKDPAATATETTERTR